VKISKKNLKTLIENILFEQEDATKKDFDFSSSERVQSAPGIYGYAHFLNNEYLTKGPNYLLTDNQSLYSIAGGVSNKKSINDLPGYLKQLIFLISSTVMTLNKLTKDEVRNVVIVSSLERTAESQLTALKNKVKISLDQGMDPVETVASLYSPENDTSMTGEGYNNAVKVVNLIQQGKDEEALAALRSVPISPHFTNNAIDFRAEGGRGKKVLAAIEHLKSINILNQNFNHVEEDVGTGNHHIHVAAIANPFTQKGKDIIRKINDPNERNARKVINYMKKVGLIE